MKQSLFAVIIFLTFFSCESTQNDELITEQEALDFVQRYDAAWNSKDSVTVKKLFGSTYWYFDSQGGLTPKERTLQIIAAPYYKILSAKREEIQVLIHENVATISSRWIGNGLWKEQPFNDNQRCGLTLVKKRGEIKLIAEHCVEIKQETAWQ